MEEKDKFVVYGNDEGYRVFERSLDQYITKHQLNDIKAEEFKRYVNTGIFPQNHIQDIEQQRVDRILEMRRHHEEREIQIRQAIGLDPHRFVEDKLQRSNPQPINNNPSSLGKGLFEQIRQSNIHTYNSKMTKKDLENIFKTMTTPAGHTIKYIDGDLKEITIGYAHPDVTYTTINKIFNE